VNNVGGAIADIRARADKKRTDVAFQQMEQRYREAAANNDKNGLLAARGDFQTIVQGGGPHADSAQQYLADINRKLDALNAPPPQPATVPTKPAPNTEVAPTVTSVNTTEENAIRAALDQFNLAFSHGSKREVKAIWPRADQKHLDAMSEPGYRVTMALNAVGQVTIIKDTAFVPCNLVTTTKGRGQTNQTTKAVRVSLEKSGDRWQIVDPFGSNP